MRVCLAAFLISGVLSSADRPPKAGLNTPGIRIPFANLKAEAEIAIALLSGDADALLSGDTVYVASKPKDALIPVDAKTNKASDPIPGFAKPCSAMLNAFGSIWVPNCADQKISRLDPKTKKITASVSVPVFETRRPIAASSDSVWVLTDEKTTLARIDPEENRIVAEVRLPVGCNSVLFAENALWVTCPKENKVLRIDPATNLVSHRIEAPPEPVSLAFGESSVWALCKTDGKVARIDPKTNKSTATIELKTPGLGGDIAFGEGFAWVSSPGFPIMRIDPSNDKVAQQFTGPGGGALYVGAAAIWIPNLKPGTLSRFDPKRVKATLAE